MKFLNLVAFFVALTVCRTYDKYTQSGTRDHFRFTSTISLAQNNFSRKNINTISMYLLALFIVKNFLKILRANPEFWGCIIFKTKLVLTGLFLETVITYWSTYRLPSLCNIWKKFLKLISRKLKIYKFRPPPFIPAFTEAVHRAL